MVYKKYKYQIVMSHKIHVSLIVLHNTSVNIGNTALLSCITNTLGAEQNEALNRSINLTLRTQRIGRLSLHQAD
jgi:hypothetical protein